MLKRILITLTTMVMYILNQQTRNKTNRNTDMFLTNGNLDYLYNRLSQTTIYRDAVKDGGAVSIMQPMLMINYGKLVLPPTASSTLSGHIGNGMRIPLDVNTIRIAYDAVIGLHLFRTLTHLFSQQHYLNYQNKRWFHSMRRHPDIMVDRDIILVPDIMKFLYAGRTIEGFLGYNFWMALICDELGFIHLRFGLSTSMLTPDDRAFINNNSQWPHEIEGLLSIEGINPVHLFAGHHSEWMLSTKGILIAVALFGFDFTKLYSYSPLPLLNIRDELTAHAKVFMTNLLGGTVSDIEDGIWEDSEWRSTSANEVDEWVWKARSDFISLYGYGYEELQDGEYLDALIGQLIKWFN